VDIVAGEVTGLPVPAFSEIVVEGWLTPDRREPEGPFGEWTGYYSGSSEPVLTLDIERIYHRHNPIQLGPTQHSSGVLELGDAAGDFGARDHQQ
jgi:UbiD family decarboxylase